MSDRLRLTDSDEHRRHFQRCIDCHGVFLPLEGDGIQCGRCEVRGQARMLTIVLGLLIVSGLVCGYQLGRWLTSTGSYF